VHSDWSVFFTYCTKARGLFPANPIEDVERPVAKRPPIAFYELEDVKRIVGAGSSAEMRALWALMYGTGIEVSVALTIRRQDFDEKRKEVRARGTKAHSRDRICRVADWADQRIAVPRSKYVAFCA
jgi:integrase